MTDRKILFTLMGAATVSGFIVICTLGQTVYHQKVEAKSAEIVRTLPDAEYIIREYNGKVAVFRGESPIPYMTADCELSLLSDYDKAALKQGVTLKTAEEVNTYLEDLTT